MTPESLLDLLDGAEPQYASGVFTEFADDELVTAVLFAYRHGGSWALINSAQGVRISDSARLWSAYRGSPEVEVCEPPGYHSGSLRDMLLPRWRSFRPRNPARQKLAIGSAPESVRVLERDAYRVKVIGDPDLPDWVMDVDAETGVVLADRFVSSAGLECGRTFVTLNLGAPLPGDLFTWHHLDGAE